MDGEGFLASKRLVLSLRLVAFVVDHYRGIYAQNHLYSFDG